jgi:hypothetical protein
MTPITQQVEKDVDSSRQSARTAPSRHAYPTAMQNCGVVFLLASSFASLAGSHLPTSPHSHHK